MAHESPEALTQREREVLEHLKLRRTNKEIAQALVVDERTVESHVSHVLRELGYKDRRELREDLSG